MSRSSKLGLIGILLLGVACGGEGDGRDPGGNSPQAGSGPVTSQGGSGNTGAVANGGNAPLAGNGSGGSSEATGGSGHGPQVPEFTSQCDAPKTGRPVLRLLNSRELERTINDVFPELVGAWSNGLPAPEVSSLGFDNDSRTTVGGQFAARLLETAESIGAAVTGDKLTNLLPCAATADRACASEFLGKYGRRLFRRGLTEAETTRFLGLFDSAVAKSDFKGGIKWMTAALVQSPSAVYRSEIGTKQPDGTRTLTPHEIATELAYTYTGSTPTPDLLDKADSGNLGDTAALAKAMFATAEGKQQFQRFFEAYLGYPRVAAIDRVSNGSEFHDVNGDMIEETRRFLDQILISETGGVKELLTSPTTTVSAKLANHYGFPAPPADWGVTMRPAGRGIGVLAQGSFLALRANSDTSSPTQRGLFVLRRLLCRDAPPPPGNVPPLAEPPTSSATTRERYEKAHAAGSCANCHQIFDPIGFGFEHFDQVGRYRDTENGAAINSVSFVPNLDGSHLIEFSTQEELMTKLAELPEVYQCFSGFLSTYAFGTADACLGSSQVSGLRDGSVGIADAFVKLSSEPHFSRRAAQ